MPFIMQTVNSKGKYVPNKSTGYMQRVSIAGKCVTDTKRGNARDRPDKARENM